MFAIMQSCMPMPAILCEGVEGCAGSGDANFCYGKISL